LAVRCTVQKSRPSSDVKVKVKGEGHRGQKTKKCDILLGSRPLGCGPRAAFCSGTVLGGLVSSSMLVGKSVHAIKFFYIKLPL